MKSIQIALSLGLLCVSFALGANKTKSGSFKFENDTFIADYIDIDATEQLFFTLFESRSKPDTDPLIIWLQG